VLLLENVEVQVQAPATPFFPVVLGGGAFLLLLQRGLEPLLESWLARLVGVVVERSPAHAAGRPAIRLHFRSHSLSGSNRRQRKPRPPAAVTTVLVTVLQKHSGRLARQ